VLSRFFLVDQTGTMTSVGEQPILRSHPQSQAVAVVDRTADLQLAAKHLYLSRTFSSSKSPYAPTCILVNEFVAKDLLHLLNEPPPEISRRLHLNQNGIPSLQKHTNKSKEPAVCDGTIEAKRFRLMPTSLRCVEGGSGLTERARLTGFRGDAAHKQIQQDDAVLVWATTSLDDAIDILNNSYCAPQSALYVFAEPYAAKYLTQFISTRVSFVNHIPANLLGKFRPLWARDSDPGTLDD
jgi:aldehyde dehydrogenase (NAD+)